jgi:uncharacterized protein YqgC (DUF456 family)
MEWLLYLVAAIFFLLGAACVFLVVIQLPGGWVLLGLALFIEYADRWYIPAEGDRQTFPWWLLGVNLGLLIVGEIIEFIAGMAGAKKGGATRRGAWGALIGGILGAFVFTPVFFFVPFVGTLLGAILGTFVGAIVGELTAPQTTIGGSMRPAWGATVGRVVGTVAKLAIAITVWLSLSISAFWP